MIHLLAEKCLIIYYLFSYYLLYFIVTCIIFTLLYTTSSSLFCHSLLEINKIIHFSLILDVPKCTCAASENCRLMFAISTEQTHLSIYPKLVNCLQDWFLSLPRKFMWFHFPFHLKNTHGPQVAQCTHVKRTQIYYFWYSPDTVLIEFSAGGTRC